MEPTSQSGAPKIRKFIDHYADVPATQPVIEDSIVTKTPPVQATPPKNMDSLSPQQPPEPETPQVVGNQGTRSNPSAAMQRTFDLQEEINRRRQVEGK